MSKGWAVGTRTFKKALKEEHKELAVALKRGDRELEDMREEEREAALHALLKCLRKGPTDISGDAKGAPWKVAIAAEMKRRTTASNPWLSKHLNMGSPFRLSRLVSACDRATGDVQKLRRKCAKCKF
jgi:predicted ATP-binding protein involved in virulence